MRKIELDGGTADRIALLVLKYHRELLQEQLTQWQKNPKSETNPSVNYLHPEDVTENMLLVMALDLLVQYFGGKDET